MVFDRKYNKTYYIKSYKLFLFKVTSAVDMSLHVYKLICLRSRLLYKFIRSLFTSYTAMTKDARPMFLNYHWSTLKYVMHLCYVIHRLGNNFVALMT